MNIHYADYEYEAHLPIEYRDLLNKRTDLKFLISDLKRDASFFQGNEFSTFPKTFPSLIKQPFTNQPIRI